MHARVVRIAGWLWLAAILLPGCAASDTAFPAGPSPEPPSIVSMLDARYSAYLAQTEAYGALGLEALRVRLAQDPPPFLLDVRTMDEAQATGHIEGAVLVPLQELAQRTEFLPGFDTTIVTYCGSGWRCTMALPVLAALGWKSVYTLQNGSLSGWIAQGLPVVAGAPPEPPVLHTAEPDPILTAHMAMVLTALPEDDGAIMPEQLAEALSEDGGLVLIDVREADEIQRDGFIAWDRQVRIPMGELISQRANWPAETSTPIVTYCGTGYRCLLAMMMLRTYGYQDVYNLVGELRAWQAAGYPVSPAP